MLLLGDITGGNGGRKLQSMDRGPNHILNLWGDGSVLSQLYDITQYTLDDASAPMTLPRQPVRLVINVAQSKNSVDSQA